MNALETILTAIADRLRVLSGLTGKISLAQMPQLIQDHWQYHDLNEEDFVQRTLTSITIPSGVTSIVDSAFAYCTALTNVTIPNSVTSIGGNAFRYCSNLTSVTIPNSVTSIKDYTFFECIKLTSVTIPNSVTSINGMAFGSCSSLMSVTIPSSVTSIGDNAFWNCSSLTDIYCGFAEGAVSGAPWGATNATIHYNS